MRKSVKWGIVVDGEFFYHCSCGAIFDEKYTKCPGCNDNEVNYTFKLQEYLNKFF